jgi:hypothetical protein
MIEGPGFGPTEAATTSVDGNRVYRAVLPSGTIQPGSFSVRTGGESEVGALTSIVQIGSGINITSSFPPGTVLRNFGSVRVNWTGGDPDSWVTVTAVNHFGSYDSHASNSARASAGTVEVGLLIQSGPLGRGEIIVEVTPDPDRIPALSAPALSLGGRHLWKHTYRFPDLGI